MGWNWERICRHIPMYMKEAIDLVQPPSLGGSDVPYWNIAPNGEFSIKTPYDMLSNAINTEDNVNPLFDKVWKWQGPARIRATLWKIAHGRLLTNEERVRRCMTSDIEWVDVWKSRNRFYIF